MIFHVKLLVFWPRSSPCLFLAVFEPCYFVMIWYHHIGTIRCLPGICVSNPGEAIVELYGHLRSRTFGYEVSLGLFHPLIMDEVAPIVWGNLYTNVELLKPIRIAASLEWANARMGYYD